MCVCALTNFHVCIPVRLPVVCYFPSGQACDPVDCACGQVEGRRGVLLGLRLEANAEWNRTTFPFSLTRAPCACTL